MYPKQHITERGSPEAKKQAKREQLCNLLVNKFRNKLKINMASERALDQQVLDLVFAQVMGEQVATERQLTELDRCVSKLVNDYRGKQPYSKTAMKILNEPAKQADDARSNRSYRSAASQRHASQPSGRSANLNVFD